MYISCPESNFAFTVASNDHGLLLKLQDPNTGIVTSQRCKSLNDPRTRSVLKGPLSHSILLQKTGRKLPSHCVVRNVHSVRHNGYVTACSSFSSVYLMGNRSKDTIHHIRKRL